MYLVCFRPERYFLLIAHVCTLSIFTAGLVLELPCKTLETFYVLWITTLWTSILPLMNMVRTKSLLVGWSWMVVLTWVPLLTLWSGLVRMLSLLALAWWEVCSLMSYQVHLNHLAVTCNLFYVMCSILWWFHLFSKLPNFACRKLLQINITIIDGLHLWGKTGIFLCAQYLQFLVGTWQETPVFI